MLTQKEKEEVIKLGLKKITNPDTSPTWNEIGKLYGIDGETARQIVKKYRYKQGIVDGKYSKDKTRILHISDLHYPFNLPIDVLKDYKDKVDILVINGDEQDCQSISKFQKKYRIPFVDEMIGTRQMLIDIINLINPKEVILNYGNHNTRFINYFSEKLNEDLLELMPQTNLDLIIDDGFIKYDHKNQTKTFYEPLVKMFQDKIKIIYTKNWFCKVGNTIFAHPKAYRNGILSTTEKAYLHFLQNGYQFGCLVLAHTHQSGFAKYGKNCYLYESGALCYPLEYSITGSLTRPQSEGFLYLIQDKNGNLIYDETKLVCL